MTPDTNFITPQPNENDVGGSFDMHRWQQFSVLPDRWKGEKYGGAGKACLLYVDWCDRRGVEGRFVSILDTIGMTGTVKLGAHNGWHAPGTTSIVNLDVRTNPSVAVGLNAQPGFSWDMYGVKGGESPTMSAGQIGSRLANRSGMGYAAGRESRQGPTAEMLRTYYRMVAILTGDLSAEIFGPLADRSQDDISLLTNFLTSALSPLPPPELLVQGSGFVQSETASGAAHPAHTQFLRDRLGVMLGDPSYPVLSGNTNACVDLHTTTSLAFQHDIYGAPNPGGNSANDVLQRNPAMTEAVEGSYYEPIGPNTPYVAEVVWRGSALRNWTALTSGYDATSLDARYCNTDGGRHAYYYYMLNQVFPYCVPYLSIDVPNAGRRLADYLKIGSAVMRTSPSTVRLGVGHAGRIQVRIYDVVGRRVRTLADRVFAAGEHTLAWDGTDDAGTKLAHGVYFVRSSNEKGSGRIVVLSR